MEDIILNRRISHTYKYTKEYFSKCVTKYNFSNVPLLEYVLHWFSDICLQIEFLLKARNCQISGNFNLDIRQGRKSLLIWNETCSILRITLVSMNQCRARGGVAKVGQFIIWEEGKTKEMGRQWLSSIISASHQKAAETHIVTRLCNLIQRYFILDGGIFGANLILCALTNLISVVDKSDLLLLKCLISFRKVVQLEIIVQWQIWCFLTRSIATRSFAPDKLKVREEFLNHGNIYFVNFVVKLREGLVSKVYQFPTFFQ